MCVEEILFSLIRSEICGDSTNTNWNNELTSKTYKELFILSRKHDLSHLVASALSHAAYLGDDEVSHAFHQELARAVYRDAQRDYAINLINDSLEQAQIPHINLKGTVIRQYYPEPWMRTSCDIDILVQKDDLNCAANDLKERLEYQIKGESSHDLSLFSPNGVHVELHYDLNEPDYKIFDPLKNVWNYIDRTNGFQLKMPDELFYFYHIAHMAKHFENGGCGIRPFLDLWILEHRVEHSDEARNHLLEQGGLLPFANACRKLSAIWFDHGMHDTTTKQMQSYILFGGVYGTLDNRVAVHQNKKGGRIKYIVSRIFLPYDSLKFMYPILQKHRWLTPFMQVRRWFRLLRKGRMKQSLHELNVNKSMSKEKISETAELLTKLGLQ